MRPLVIPAQAGISLRKGGGGCEETPAFARVTEGADA